MLKELIAGSFILFIIGLNGYAKVPAFKNYVIFGDSLSDVGNYTTNSNNCIYFNAPITNPVENGKTKQKNSTWANAGRLKNIMASNEGGDNYAVAGYTTAQILTSVKNYKIHHQANPDTLYIIWAGTNDVLHALGNHWSDVDVKQALIDGTDNITTSITNLYEVGARNFLVIGLMDLSQTPMFSYPHPDPSLLLGVFPKEDKLKLQQVCVDWNNHFLPNALKLFKKSHTDSHIYTWNPTMLLADMSENPSDYGYPPRLLFNTPHTKIQDRRYLTAQITYCGNTAKNADRNPSHYLFYNFIHPTPSAYQLMEQDMMKTAAEL